MQDDLYFSMKLMELSRSFKDQMGKLDHDIPFALRQICLYVQQHPGCCQEDIARELVMDKSLLGRNVRKAQQMGLLERKVSPVDNRRVELYLCEKGITCNQHTVEAMVSWQQAIQKGMTVSEKRQLIYLLERLNVNPCRNSFSFHETAIKSH